MAEPRKQFTFYRSYYDAIQALPQKDQSAIILAVCAYALYEREPEKLSPVASTAFELIRPTLNSSRKRAEIGKIGGSKPKANTKQRSSKGQANAKQTASEKEKEKEIEIEIENDRSEGEAFLGFERIWDRYPEERRGSMTAAWEAFQSNIGSEAEADAALENLELWKRSEQWDKDGGQFITYLSNWLERGLWKTKPARMVRNGPRELDELEIEAIRRMMDGSVDRALGLSEDCHP